MKAVYYRWQRIPTIASFMIMAFSCVAIALVRNWPASVSDTMAETMTRAVEETQASFETIYCERVSNGDKMLSMHDPSGSGMMGKTMSMVTTLPGHLDAKQTSVNPEFAAVAVRLLNEAGVVQGDTVAIGMTGSFPALNIAVIQAAESMELRPLIVSSAASSQYGANDPNMMWPDMEALLAENGLIETRSIAISRGGFRDIALGLDEEALALIDAAIERSGRPELSPDDEVDAIDLRMQLFQSHSGDRPIAAYVNVGGGDASVGGTDGNDLLKSGMIRPRRVNEVPETLDSCARRFLAAGVPVVNMVNVVNLAEKYGLPVGSEAMGQRAPGKTYTDTSRQRIVAFCTLVFLTTAIWITLRPPPFLLRRFSSKADSTDGESLAAWSV